jgi:hypothetical protein
MSLLVFTAIGLIVFVLAIGFDLGGSIGAMLFLLILLTGGILRAWAPLVDWVRGPASKL